MASSTGASDAAQVQAGVVRLVPRPVDDGLVDFSEMEHVARAVFHAKRKIIVNNIGFIGHFTDKSLRLADCCCRTHPSHPMRFWRLWTLHRALGRRFALLTSTTTTSLPQQLTSDEIERIASRLRELGYLPRSAAP